MNWTEVCENKALQDLPFKIELNEWGHITMRPASNKHGHIQVLIVFTLMQQKTAGRVLTECSVQTSQGVKVADVAWGSDDFFAATGWIRPISKRRNYASKSAHPPTPSARCWLKRICTWLGVPKNSGSLTKKVV